MTCEYTTKSAEETIVLGRDLASLLVPATGNAHHGVTWHYTRPPIVGIEYEMDVRGCAREIVLAV